MEGLSVEKTYFEEHAEEMLSNAGITKAQFAKAVGVAPQNISKLFSTKNILTLSKVSTVLNVSLNFLLNGAQQSAEDIHGCLFVNGTPILINSLADLEEFIKQNK